MREVGRDLTDDGPAPSAPPTPRRVPLPDTFETLVSARHVATRRAAERRGRSSAALRIAAATAAVGALGLFLALTDGGRSPRSPSGLLPDLETTLSYAGFGLDLVTVAGHRFTTDLEILDALDLTRQRTWASLDTRAARARLERLPWVASASITRIYPGRLDVHVTERTVWAVWQHGTRETLIDATGRTLSDIRPGSRPDLPRYAGDGAPVEAPSLAAALARHAHLARRVAVAERVAGRRWTLRLDNGATVLLPADREVQALDSLAGNRGLARLLATPGRVLDLRTMGRIAVRTAGVADATDAASPRAGSPARRVASGEP